MLNFVLLRSQPAPTRERMRRAKQQQRVIELWSRRVSIYTRSPRLPLEHSKNGALPGIHMVTWSSPPVWFVENSWSSELGGQILPLPPCDLPGSVLHRCQNRSVDGSIERRQAQRLTLQDDRLAKRLAGSPVSGGGSDCSDCGPTDRSCKRIGPWPKRWFGPSVR